MGLPVVEVEFVVAGDHSSEGHAVRGVVGGHVVEDHAVGAAEDRVEDAGHYCLAIAEDLDLV